MILARPRPDRKRVEGVFFDPTKYDVIVKPIIDASGDNSVDYGPGPMDFNESGFLDESMGSTQETPKRQQGNFDGPNH